jgi:uncharacterized membrane protein YdjX (TVP38/TMEM64 family)
MEFNFFIFLGLVKTFVDTHEILSICLFMILHVLFGFLFFPCSIFTLSAGILWGSFIGLTLSIIAMSLTVLLTSFGNFSHFNMLLFKADKLIKKVTKLRGHKNMNDFVLIAILCLNPIIPGSSAGYFWKLTSLSRLKFVFFACFFMLPYQFLYIYAGLNLRDILIGTSKKIFFILTIMLIYGLNLIIKHYFNKINKFS